MKIQQHITAPYILTRDVFINTKIITLLSISVLQSIKYAYFLIVKTNTGI